MAKKIIKGSSKLNKSAKLEHSEPMNLIQRNVTTSPKSFRFTTEDMDRLNAITKNIDKLTSLSFSNTKVLKALIYIGSITPPDKIYKAYKEIM